MNGSSFECGTGRGSAAAGPNWILQNERFKFWRRIISNNTSQHFAIEAKDKSPIGSTKPYRTFGNGFEDRLQIERRPTDDLKHIGRGGLLLKRFAEFVEEPRVLDRYDGLRGEVLNQLDLLVGEWTYFLAEHTDRSDEFALLEHWHTHIGQGARHLYEGNNPSIFPDVRLIGAEVGNVDNLFSTGDAIKRNSRIIAQVKYGITPPGIGVSLLAMDRD